MPPVTKRDPTTILYDCLLWEAGRAMQRQDNVMAQLLMSAVHIHEVRHDPKAFRHKLRETARLLLPTPLHTRVCQKVFFHLERTFLLKIPAYVRHYASD